MGAMAERQDVAGPARDIQFTGVGSVLTFVPVARAVEEQHPAALRDGDALHRDVTGHGAAQALCGCGQPQELVDGVGNQLDILDQQASLVGALVQRFIIQKLLNADEHIQIFATVGLSTALVNLALILFGADLYSVNAPEIRRSVTLGPYNALIGHLVIFGAAAALVAGLHVFMQKTPLGRAIRATAQNRNAAMLMGVRVERIYIISFGLGAACVGLASALIMPLYPVTPTIGSYFVLTAFVVVVLGGMRSMIGAFFGAMIIGIVDSLSGYYIAPDLKEVVYFAIFLAILIFKPTGLFGFGRGTE